MEVLIDNSNENIHENEEGDQLEQNPVNCGNQACLFLTLLHDSIPRFTCACSPKSRQRDVETFKVGVFSNEISILKISEEIHSSYCKREKNEHQQCC